MFKKLDELECSEKSNPNLITSTLERFKRRLHTKSLKLKKGIHLFLFYVKIISNDC
jgi:hypothetical protein